MAEAHEDAEVEETPAVEENDADSIETEDFDKDRALRTIRKQREEEKKLKERLRELEEKASKLDKLEEDEAEAQRSLEEKLTQREARINELETKIREDAIKASFLAEARERGYKDPELAFVAAQRQGALGELDPKTGTVGDHDFDALEERHPLLADDADERNHERTGDAGVRGKRGNRTVNDVFNSSIRGAMRR